MSNTSPKKQDGNSKDTDSAEDDEEDLQDALKEMVKIPDIDERPGTSRRHFEVQDSPEKGELKKKSTRRIIQKDQAEQGSQTCENRKKVKKSSTDKKELDSDDSWAALFIKRFSWTRNPTEAVSTRSNAVNPTTKISLAEVTENNLKTGATTKSKSSTETSNESLIRTDHYGYSKSKTGETNQNQLSDEESGDESAEFLDKLKKIEEASKPKSWKRPTPIVIKANPISSTTKKTEDEVQAKPRSDNEDKHRYINILKVPFHRNLNYAAENETNNQTTNNQPPEDVDTRTSPEKVSLGSPPPNSALKFAQKNENIDGKSGENPREISAENAEQKKRVNTDSQRTLTITGHSHITTKWQDHCHFRDSQQTGSDKVAKRKLITACFLCTIFMIIEIVGGVISNSLAIATDAAHLLTDLASFLISLFALYLAGRPSSERLNFGWYRAEVIGAMISVFFIWVVTGILVYMAIMRWVHQDFDLEAKIMLITSALAILFNIIMAVQLNHGHSHFSPGTLRRSMAIGSQDHVMVGRSVSAQFSVKGEQNINVRAALIHVIGDLLQSVGVFVAALIIFFKPDWAFMDSVCTFLFSVLVLVVTFKILKDVLMVLMEATPDFMDYEEVKRTFLSIPGVEHVHNLRIWALSINKIALSAHLAISKDADPQLILEEATTLIHKRYRFFETTIQIEEYSPDMENCEMCLSPSDKKEDRRPSDLEEGVGGGDRKKAERRPSDTENG